MPPTHLGVAAISPDLQRVSLRVTEVTRNVPDNS